MGLFGKRKQSEPAFGQKPEGWRAEKAKKPGHKMPWRDNVEAMTMAIVMAVMLKYFIIEAYKIPTGSMQPTLMGCDDNGLAIFDRILVDKLSYHFREPERWEVAVFKYPLDRSKNFVKRIVGMPNEEFRVALGDLWTRKSGSEPWKVLRRPSNVQREAWKAIDLADDSTAWRPDAGRWSAGHRTLSAVDSGRARFALLGDGSMVDSYVHGYPQGLARFIRPRPRSGANPVGDLRVDGRVRARDGCESVTLEFEEGARHYRLEIPGPAAPSDARPTIRVTSPDTPGNRLATDASGEPYRLPAETWVEFGAQNMDDLLELEIDGDVVASLEILEAANQRSSMWIGQSGAGADFDELQGYRDIYYTAEAKTTEIAIPEERYFMMGDNTQDSSDSREWTFEVMSWPGEGSLTEPVRGNFRPGENPIDVPTTEDMLTFFRDEWGELYVFPTRSRSRRTPESAPFVTRDQIVGRALLVFWPFAPSLGVYRLKWIR